VGTEEIFVGEELLGYRMGAECEDWQVVREHAGAHFGFDQSGLLVTSVINLGEIGRPGPTLAARFLDRYPGLFGDEAHDQVFWCYWLGKEPVYQRSVTSPAGPQRQGKMWYRERYNHPRDANWPGCRGAGVAHVDFGFAGTQAGTPAQPFNSLRNALPVLAPDGSLIINPGATGWRGTICQPVTLNSAGGTVSIGQ
jgi:hypothetical protein